MSVSDEQDLIGQTDALIRKHRSRSVGETTFPDDIPTLTDIVWEPEAVEPGQYAPQEAAGPEAADVLPELQPGDAPVQPAAHDEWAAEQAEFEAGAAGAGGEVKGRIGSEADEVGGEARLPDQPSSGNESAETATSGQAARESIDQTRVGPAAPVAAGLPVITEEQLKALSSDVYYRILQNLDIHAEDALRKYLAPRLEGMFDRALHGIMNELNHNVGALLRDYIAQALEAELENLRSQHQVIDDATANKPPGAA